MKQIVEELMADPISGYYNVTKGDYDERTAMHLACSDGQFHIVEYFLEMDLFHELNVRDRWNNTPMDDANVNNYPHIVEVLARAIEERHAQRVITQPSDEDDPVDAIQLDS